MLENWLKPLKGSLLKNGLEAGKLGSHLACYTEGLPNLKKTDIAIIGVGETEANEVRRYLYGMAPPFSKTKVADLGNLRKEENSFLVPVVQELLEGNICPVIIGRDGVNAQAQFMAHHACQPSVSVVEIAEAIYYHPEKTELDGYYMNPILEGEYRLFHYCHIGSQSHFVDGKVYQFMEQNQFDFVRLGKAKANLSALEPFVRDGDMVCFHINALKCSDAPGTLNATPSGFFCEEACQISRYAGMNDKLTSIGFYGLQSYLDPIGLTGQALAQMVWYFLDGFEHRQNDFPGSMDDLVEYIVDLKEYDHQLTFWKSNKTGRWWLQVPVKTKKKLQRHRLIPCSYDDYAAATKGELPDRLVNALKRFD